MDEKLYAVLTGDLIGSRQLKSSGISYIEHLNKSLEYVGREYMLPPFIYRGDSFQGITSEPESALKDAILLRLRLISGFNVEEKFPRIDARVSIGVGEIDRLLDEGYRLDDVRGDERRGFRDLRSGAAFHKIREGGSWLSKPATGRPTKDF